MQTVDSILSEALSGVDITPSQALTLLYSQEPRAIAALQTAADELRRQLAGETVTYVVNRNINFTNICEQHCSFCAFRRDSGAQGAFWLNQTEILAKVADAVNRGATEICMQGGLNPAAKQQRSSLAYYRQLVTSIKGEFPQIHLHAFSPQEVQFIAREDNLSYAEVLRALQEAGVGSLPGTAAEILDDNVRKVICPEKINTATWVEIVTTAHRLGLPTTSTMLSGHVETPEQQITHLHHLRHLQRLAAEYNYPAQITEFILLPFVGEQAPKALQARVGRKQPDLQQTLQLTAVARIFLGKWVVNHQPSWVKLGLDGAKAALQWGCNDLGGTLMEEHITTMAGAQGGTCLEVSQIQQAIVALGRPWQERTTLYRKIKSGKQSYVQHAAEISKL